MAIDSLVLKWGTLKYWDLNSPTAIAALKKYDEAGEHSMSAALQHDNVDQKSALCEIIDAVDCDIMNDWSGDIMSKEEAKKYVMEYGRDSHYSFSL